VRKYYLIGRAVAKEAEDSGHEGSDPQTSPPGYATGVLTQACDDVKVNVVLVFQITKKSTPNYSFPF